MNGASSSRSSKKTRNSSPYRARQSRIPPKQTAKVGITFHRRTARRESQPRRTDVGEAAHFARHLTQYPSAFG